MSSFSDSPLHVPLTFPRAGRTMRNRIALAAMTNQQSGDDGLLSDDEYAWLVRRAEGGFGMVTTCAAHVHRTGRGWPGALGIDSDACLPGLTRLANGIREAGGLAIVQIFHGGARAPSALSGVQPLSASPGILPGSGPSAESARAATTADLREIIGAFATAAHRAEQAGWDGVELHGAHGYLLAQFLSPLSNQRSDEWGGSYQNRLRFLRETLAAVKAAVSPRFIVGVRLSPENFSNQPPEVTLEAFETARRLQKDGVDFLHFSLWDCDACLRSNEGGAPGPTLLSLAREAVAPACPLLVAGKIHTRADAERALSQGADAVALGRVAIAYPEWPRAIREEAFTPAQPPHAEESLRAAAVGPKFLAYLRRWPGFVATTRDDA
ncbi:MAG: NADH:flavin oxidoreductase [Opitutales bacterium]|nr:NADH:flavin oxidoreductase [Opitutales bacterium]